ncbi:MAG: T9SS type A sorting domain-containing protein [Saprospirales bacterium]|nr:T9SS type A sorting domain-containing protein [Saprospirales bacterium]
MNFPSTKNDVQVDISTVESGMYILEIKGNNSVSYEKIFKQ